MTEVSTTNHESGGSTNLWLHRLRRTARNLLVAQRIGWLVACVLGLLLVLGLTDYILRTPAPIRAVLWVVGLGTLFLALRRSVWPAVRFNPPLTEVALRVEQSKAGRAAGLQGVLASGLELSAAPAGDVSRGLSEPVIREATRRLGGLKAAGLVAPIRTLRSLGLMASAVVAVAAIGAFEPNLTRIGAERLLWPFGQAQWPRRTGVLDITNTEVHPLGSALALRAALTRFNTTVDQTRVAARYRTIIDGTPGPVRRVLLTSQDKAVRLDEQDALSASTGTGYLFERLLEPSGLAAEVELKQTTSARDEPPRKTDVVLEYWFETEDDQTEPAQVLLVEPPVVRSASAEVRLPTYAATLADRFPDLAKSSGTLDLGPGNDERSAPAPILAGSHVTMRIKLNKEVPNLPPIVPDANVWIERALGQGALALWTGNEATPESARAELETTGAEWVFRWILSEPVRFSIKATDEHGISGAEESSFRFDTLKDNPPTATVTTPSEDKAVLSTAIVDLAGEGRDDVGLLWSGLERQLARKPSTSEGATAEPADDRVELARLDAASLVPAATIPPSLPDSRRIVVRQTLDLSTMDLKPGDELWITAAAADAYELGGVRHDVARSAPRKLRIMSREELVQQVWADLGSIRRTAVKVDEDQRELNKAVSKPGAAEARRAERTQAGLTERLARQSEALERTSERVRENALNDQALQDVLRQADDALNTAGEESNAASQSLSQAAAAEAQESPAPDAGKQEREKADEAQQQVREELAKLIDMLDQGEDTYASKRALEQMIQEQKALQQRTQQTGQQTTGKKSDQLSQDEKDQLQQIAEEQEQLAEKLNEAVDKMLEREQKMEKSDPAGAQAMAQAAQRAQREQTPEKMKQAAQQAQQNQTNNAQQRQQQAIQSMEQMLQDLEKANENRDEVLRRFLASLIDSIRGLIRQQEDQLAALDGAIEAASFKGLDAGMVRLHQNTLGVLDQAAEGPRDAERIAELIERAADAQSAAAVGLRDEPINEDEVKAQEQLSLDKLNDALEEANKADEQAAEREQERKREQLKGRYADALRVQISIREGTAPLVGAEANRRNKAAARELGVEQAALRESLTAIRTETAEIAQAKVFEYAHNRLDELTRQAADALAQGDATETVLRHETAAVRVLQSLVASLDKPKNDKPFREREQAGGGGGGGQGQQPVVPPAAEIKLLRAMQQEAADLTRSSAESTKPDAGALEDVAKLQRELADRGTELLERLAKPKNAPPKPGQPEGPQEGDTPATDEPRPGDAPESPS